MSYRIMGKYKGLAPEELDTANSLEEAEYLLGEYELAFGDTWELWIEAGASSYDNNQTCQCHRRYNPRVVSKFEDSGRSKAEKCKICGKVTREGKDLCTDHIGESDYAKKLAARLAQMKFHDEEAAENRVDISVENETVKELLLTLQLNGPRTIDRLVRELNRDNKIITNYVNALKKKQLVKTRKTKRGAIMVFLPTQS